MLVGVVMVLGLVYLGYGAFEMVFRWIGHVFGDVIYKVFGLFFGWFIT